MDDEGKKKKRRRRRRRVDMERLVSKEILFQLRFENLVLNEALKLEKNRVNRGEMYSYVR